MSAPQSTSGTASSYFTACDEIASYYEKSNVPARSSTGVFGGKSFTWYVSEQGQPYQVFCRCTMPTLGYGHMSIRSRIASKESSTRFFRKSTPVDPITSKVTLDGVLFFADKHEIRLPKDDKQRS